MLPAIKLKCETVVRYVAPRLLLLPGVAGIIGETDGGLWRQAHACTEAKSMNINTAAESRCCHRHRRLLLLAVNA